MTEEQKLGNNVKLQKWAADRLLMFIKVCPHILKSGMGAELFVEELNEAATKLNDEYKEIAGPMIDLLSFIRICPNIFKAEIGLEEFVKDLAKATSKFNLYFSERKIKEG
jgi:hypothetical protein